MNFGIIDYNNRLQPTIISLVKDSNSLQRYEYTYGVVDQSTGNVDENKNNGQIARVEGFIGNTKQWQQRFSYDSIGRLSTAGEYRGDNLSLTYQSNFSYDRFGNRYQKQAQNPQSLSSSILWSDIERLLIALGAEVTEGRGSRVRIALKGVRAVFHRPHPQKETNKGAVVSMRRFLTEAGITPEEEQQ